MHFADGARGPFHALVRGRADEFFARAGRDRFATPLVWAKGALFLGGSILCYARMISDTLRGPALLAVALGSALSGLFAAFNLAHDAAHGALSRRSAVNRLVYYTIFNLQGANAYLWRLRHIASHHVFPNVLGGDADMEPNPLLRVSPATRLRPWHRWQHLYGVLLYPLFSLHWILVYDVQFLFMRRLANLKQIRHRPEELAWLVLAKGVYFTVALGLPLAALSIPAWQVLLGFVAVHLVLSVVFVVVLIGTHLSDLTTSFEVGAGELVPGDWATHQLATSVDYWPTSRLANFFLGGFNAHAAHHLFPTVCHVHYPELSRIIARTARECGVPYHATGLAGMVRSHFRFLYQMGR